jgi:hypothetical protein
MVEVKVRVTRRSEAVKKLVRDKMLARQDAFLAVYGLTGSIRAGCEAGKVTRETSRRWRAEDTAGFSERFNDAEEDFGDLLHEIMVERIRAQGPNANPAAIIRVLDAWYPSKYKSTTVVVDQSGQEALSAFRKWSRENDVKGKSEGKVEKEDPIIKEAEDILARKSNKDRGQDPPAQV